jgi:hypothetical protein
MTAQQRRIYAVKMYTILTIYVASGGCRLELATVHVGCLCTNTASAKSLFKLLPFRLLGCCSRCWNMHEKSHNLRFLEDFPSRSQHFEATQTQKTFCL